MKFISWNVNGLRACMGKGWQEDFDAMARKTVIRKLCGKYALMSIEYQDGSDKDTVNLATALAQQDFPEVDMETGEIIEAEVEDVPVENLFEEDK